MSAKTAQLLTVGALLCIISLQNFAVIVSGDEDLVEKLCKATTNYDNCKKCVTSGPSNSTTATDIGIVQIAVNCGFRDLNTLTKDTMDCASGAADDPKLSRSLIYCFNVFHEVFGTIYSVRDKVKHRDFGGAKQIITGVILEKVSYCKQMVENEGAKMPKILSKDLDYVNRDFDGIVVKMLDALH